MGDGLPWAEEFDGAHAQAIGDAAFFMSVVVNACHPEAWLEKVLLGFMLQTHGNFELIVADGGCGPETATLVSAFEARAPFPVRHVRHEGPDSPHQEVLDQAIGLAGYDYIVIAGGDCIPRRDFLEVHASNARPGHFLSGGPCRIGTDLSWRIGPEEIMDGSCFDLAWLDKYGNAGLANRVKLGSGPGLSRLLDAIATAGATFDDRNVSAWKHDLLPVNGCGERMKHGGAGREIGGRLLDKGIRGVHIGHRAVCVRLGDVLARRTKKSLGNNG